MKNVKEKLRHCFTEKSAVTKEEFADQIIELVESEQTLLLSPEAFEFAVGWIYRKYKSGLANAGTQCVNANRWC